MSNDLISHPIFSSKSALELSTSNVSTSSRRQVMVLKDAELIVAVDRELRITSLNPKTSKTQSYKTFKTPNIQFDIRQIVVNSTGKFLAVAGEYEVAVVTLPGPDFTRLDPNNLDCKSFQVGKFHHSSRSDIAVAKIEWHPWGYAGSTLLVMTVDGKLREYDLAVDQEEPQQVLNFGPEKNRRRSTFMADDPQDTEFSSFTLGKGRGDWGPLTVYGVMRSGDVYSICPYMPQNTSVSSSYIHSLECFISAKQEFLNQTNTSANAKNLLQLYDYQQKYVSALVKQLPPGTVFPAVSRSVLMHPPTTIKSDPVRQGPFLLQPSPRGLQGSEGGDATDIAYLTFGGEEEYDPDNGVETEHIGVVLLAHQDGRVDLCLDVEKVEARWRSKSNGQGLPMLAVYESIDLGLVSTLKSITPSPRDPPILDLLRGNHPILLADPVHDDTVYVSHAFGLHALNLDPVIQSLSAALRAEDDRVGSALESALQSASVANVQPILSTFSVERRCSNPVIGVAVPDDVYITYSIFILTSAMRIATFTLNPRSHLDSKPPTISDKGKQPEHMSRWLSPVSGPPPYISLLGSSPFTPAPVLSSRLGLPTNPTLALPTSKQATMALTPDTLRYLAKTSSELTRQMHEVQLAYKAAEVRAVIQKQELSRLCSKYRELSTTVNALQGPRRQSTDARVSKVQDQQSALLSRLDRMLQNMMQSASPELSETETKWFEELRRMKAEVNGSGKYDDTSLVARTKLLQREYERVLPGLKTLTEKEKERKAKLDASTSSLGFSQAFELGEKSNLEKLRLAEMEQNVVALADKLDVTLSRPPRV